ncbi:hypothetical protein [Sorangium sp. So ce363]|uniref:hypothetical protein n=1 Tax=Sorangium sp. So ce363 TaxID=3133304 RepID=UPI003F603CF1
MSTYERSRAAVNLHDADSAAFRAEADFLRVSPERFVGKAVARIRGATRHGGQSEQRADRARAIPYNPKVSHFAEAIRSLDIIHW